MIKKNKWGSLELNGERCAVGCDRETGTQVCATEHFEEAEPTLSSDRACTACTACDEATEYADASTGRVPNLECGHCLCFLSFLIHSVRWPGHSW